MTNARLASDRVSARCTLHPRPAEIFIGVDRYTPKDSHRARASRHVNQYDTANNSVNYELSRPLIFKEPPDTTVSSRQRFHNRTDSSGIVQGVPTLPLKISTRRYANNECFVKFQNQVFL